MKTVAIIQARMRSFRLPGKVLLPLVGKPMLWHVVQRARAAVPDVVVATSTDKGDDAIADFCETEHIPYHRGSEHDVLDRYYWAAARFEADPIIRITGDCPLIQPGLIRAVLGMLKAGLGDFVAVNTGGGALYNTGNHFPDGVDVEGYPFRLLLQAWVEATSPSDREHVSMWMHREGRPHALWLTAPEEYRHHRWTVDHPEDYELVKKIYESLWAPDRHFTMEEVLAFLEARPDVYAVNRQWVGHEGYAALWGKQHAS